MGHSAGFVIFLTVVLLAAACASTQEKKPKPGTPRPTSEELARQLGLSDEPDRLPAARIAGSRAVAKDAYAPGKLGLTDLDGRGVSLSDANGYWLLLMFFTSYDLDSISGLPTLQEIQDRYAAGGLKVVAVSLDFQGRTMVKPYVAELEIRFPVLLAAGETKNGETPWGFFEQIPVTLLIDPGGRMVKGYLGPLEMEKLQNDLAGKVEARSKKEK